MQYKIEFYGRLRGAIGVFYNAQRIIGVDAGIQVDNDYAIKVLGFEYEIQCIESITAL